MENEKRVLHTFKKEKDNTKQLVIISVLISFGVNVLTTGVISYYGLEKNSIILIIIGILLSLGIILFLFISNVKRLNKDVKIDGFVIYNQELRELTLVPKYDISEDMVRYLNASFIENKALKKLWYDEPINQFKIVGGKPGERAIAISTHSGAIFIELLEYCVIEQLSLHLSSYFNNSGLARVKEFEREDIPDVLLENRFLQLFSEDMHNREVFVETDDKKDFSQGGKVVSAYHPSGAIYKKFDLILPDKSRIKRINKNQIIIETNMLSLSLSCLFGGFGTVLERGFHKYYLGIEEEYPKFHDYQFTIEITIKFKLRSFFFSDKWKYYLWADDFIEKLTKYLSQEAFFHRINWDTVYTLLQCEKNNSDQNNS
jgi:hypothetical protein